MKKILLIQFFLILGITANGQRADESYSYASETYIEKHLDLPIVRKLAGGTIFNVTYEGTWTNEMKGAFEYACKVWEENLPTALPINIVAKIGRIRQSGGAKPISKVEYRTGTFVDNDYETVSMHLSSQVKYVLLAEFMNGYQHYFLSADSAFIMQPDITITYNEDLLDDISYSLYSTPTNKYDFVTLVLRDIAIGLGFNWSFKANVNEKRMSVDETLCTPYEKHIMDAIGSNDPYVIYKNATKGTLDINIPNYGKMTLYAPTAWQAGLSLNSFISDSTKNITKLLSNEFGKGTVIRNITDDYSVLLKNAMDWYWHDAPVGDPSNQNSAIYTSTDQVIPYGGTITNVQNSLQTVSMESGKTGLTAYAKSDNNVQAKNNTGFSINDYCKPYDCNFIAKNSPLTHEGYTIALLKKDGTWDVVSIVELDEDFEINVNNLNLEDDISNYARTCDGYLRCRVNRCMLGYGYNQVYRSQRTRYYVLDYLPQRVKMDFSGIMPMASTRSVANEYLRDIKIGIKNLEGVERVVVEQLDEGERVPSKFEVTDFKDGYFVATVDKEFYSDFTVVSYNKNGGTRSETFTVEPLEPAEQNYNVQVLDNEIRITSARERKKSKKMLVSYEILPIDEYTIRPIVNNMIENNKANIDITSLSKGTYVLNYYDVRGCKHSVKFRKK